MEQIVIAASDAEFASVRRLFGAYRRAVEEFASAAEVCAWFDDMSTELVQLRSFYAEPGFVLLATGQDGRTGCVALRTLWPGVGEVRRLFVAPAGRSCGLGRQLMVRLMDESRARGFGRLVLNTLPTMTHAERLYRNLGFAPVDPYVPDPTEGVVSFGADLWGVVPSGGPAPARLVDRAVPQARR